MTGHRIEIYLDDSFEYRWRRVGGNGEIVAHGEGHPRKWSAIRAAVPLNRDVPADQWWDWTRRPRLRVRSTLLDGLA